LLAASCRPFPPPLSTSPSRSFLSSQEPGVVAVVRFRTASECVMSSFILTPVYRWLQAQRDSLVQPNPPLPLTLAFWMKTTTSWMWNIIRQRNSHSSALAFWMKTTISGMNTHLVRSLFQTRAPSLDTYFCTSLST
jgi:hypothetical protein